MGDPQQQVAAIAQAAIEDDDFESEEGEDIAPPPSNRGKEKRVVYYKKDEPAVVKTEWIEKKQASEAAARKLALESKTAIPSQSSLLRNARERLIMSMEHAPDLAKRLRLTPTNVMKMDLEKIENHIETFEAHNGLGSAASVIKWASTTFIQAVEGTVGLSKLKDKILLQGWSEKFKEHPELDDVCTEVAISRMDTIREYVTPEARLGFIMLETGGQTHLSNMKNGPIPGGHAGIRQPVPLEQPVMQGDPQMSPEQQALQQKLIAAHNAHNRQP